MTYHAALILKNVDGGYGVQFPDFPGCVARATTLDDVLGRAEEALSVHVEELNRQGRKLPRPISLDTVLAAAKADDAAALLIRLPSPKGRAVRVNITLDEHLLADIDAAAKRDGATRSGFLAAAARATLNPPPHHPAPAPSQASAEEEAAEAFRRIRDRIARDERERLYRSLMDDAGDP